LQNVNLKLEVERLRAELTSRDELLVKSRAHISTLQHEVDTSHRAAHTDDNDNDLKARHHQQETVRPCA
jgi:hypothetical protein